MALAPERLKQLSESWHEIEPSEMVRETAMRFLRVHPLRAADALQLAAAFIAAAHRPASLQVITLDDRLADAARKEGFALSPRTRSDRGPVVAIHSFMPKPGVPEPTMMSTMFTP